jgi:uncharacterized protein (DUF488 family)
MLKIYTIGHSNHTLERFLSLLQVAQIKRVLDVRSVPRSRRFPQFNRNALEAALKVRGIEYVWLGDRLGGRARDSASVRDYGRMANESSFIEGLSVIATSPRGKPTTLLCSEHEPLECHRCILIGRHLANMRIEVRHILRDGSIENHRQTEDRLLAYHGAIEPELLASRSSRLAAAYERQSQHMKYRPPKRMR